MDEDDRIRAAVVAERREQADLLATLTPEQWDAPTLCAGWRVREVVAHMTMPYRMKMPAFLLGMIKARGNFNRMADRQARADTARFSDADLLAQLRDNVAHHWKPPGGGLVGALSHDVIHGLDISVGLGLQRRVPPARVGVVLAGLRDKNLNYFGSDLSGVRLEANDLDWTFGEGEPLRGAAQDLLLVLCGRRLPAGRLDGGPAARYAQV